MGCHPRTLSANSWPLCERVAARNRSMYRSHHIMQPTIDGNVPPDPNGYRSNHCCCCCCSSTHSANFSLGCHYIPVVTFDSNPIRTVESAQSNCCPIDCLPRSWAADNIAIDCCVGFVECTSMHATFASRSTRTDSSYSSIESVRGHLCCRQNNSEMKRWIKLMTATGKMMEKTSAWWLDKSEPFVQMTVNWTKI